jgi:hypothetical protein
MELKFINLLNGGDDIPQGFAVIPHNGIVPWD